MTAEMPLSTKEPQRPLDALFQPRSIAVIGATEAARAVGRIVLENLSTFPGPVYAVNPRHAEVLGRRCYASIAEVPGGPI